MKLLFAGYRSWAQEAFFDLTNQHQNVNFRLALTTQSLQNNLERENWDVITLVGWSWIVPDHIINSNYVVCYHPSDLPAYAGGSPIQHQIIDGIEKTKASLIKVTNKLDAGPILFKEEISLEGHITDIFYNLRKSACSLLTNLIVSWPNIAEFYQNPNEPLKRLKPSDSELDKNEFLELNCKQLYDMIRCREDPYPNAFIRDKTGTLYFEKVRFIKNGKS